MGSQLPEGADWRGESDPITGLLAWTDYNMLVFKKNSIYVINLDPSQNPDPDDPTLLVASFAVKQLHKRIGCPAPLSAVQVGGGSTTPGSDVFFLDGDKKVHSIRRVMAAETQQEVGQAMSLPIQDVLDTINLDHIDKACGDLSQRALHDCFPQFWNQPAGCTEQRGYDLQSTDPELVRGMELGTDLFCYADRFGIVFAR